MSRRKKPFPFFLWHRRLGLVALLMVFILSITGIMLNHTETLKLDETTIESELLLNWYGINPQGSSINFYTPGITGQDSDWLSQWDQQLFLNGQPIISHQETLRGAVALNGIIAVALTQHILLLDNAGDIIELMNFRSESSIKQIGLSDNQLAIIDEAKQFYLADTQISQWTLNNAQKTRWSTPADISEEQVLTLKRAFRGEGIFLERVILDLHSGRIFNAQWGVYVMDASAIIMMLLGLSGLWVWWSRQLKMRQKKHYKKHHK